MQDLDRRIVLQRWEEATEQALTALRAWRSRLAKWGNGGLVSREEIRQALSQLTQVGLDEWAEWGAEENLDELADLLSGEAEDLAGEDLEDLEDEYE